jgi:hypothetical protein
MEENIHGTQFSQNPTSGETAEVAEVELIARSSFVPKIVTSRENRASPGPEEFPLSPLSPTTVNIGSGDPSTTSKREQRLLRAKATVQYCLESSFFTGLMSIYTLWALYNEDIKLAGTSKDADLGFEVVISIGFFLFLLEIAAQCFYKPDYFKMPIWKRKEDETDMEMWWRRAQIGSFYFWLDWIATLSLILEALFYFVCLSSPN